MIWSKIILKIALNETYETIVEIMFQIRASAVCTVQSRHLYVHAPILVPHSSSPSSFLRVETDPPSWGRHTSGGSTPRTGWNRGGWWAWPGPRSQTRRPFSSASGTTTIPQVLPEADSINFNLVFVSYKKKNIVSKKVVLLHSYWRL